MSLPIMCPAGYTIPMRREVMGSEYQSGNIELLYQINVIIMNDVLFILSLVLSVTCSFFLGF